MRGRLQQRHAEALNEIAELGGTEIEQPQHGIDGEMVVEQPHAIAFGEGPSDGQLSGTRRPVDNDVLTSSASLDHVTCRSGSSPQPSLDYLSSDRDRGCGAVGYPDALLGHSRSLGIRSRSRPASRFTG